MLWVLDKISWLVINQVSGCTNAVAIQMGNNLTGILPPHPKIKDLLKKLKGQYSYCLLLSISGPSSMFVVQSKIEALF